MKHILLLNLMASAVLKTLLAVIVFAVIMYEYTHAATSFHKGLTPEVSKFEALRASYNDPTTKIYRCSEVAITENGSFKNLPNSRKNDFVDKSKGKADEKSN